MVEHQYQDFERVVDAVNRAQRHWAERRQAIEAARTADAAVPPPGVTIALSREAGTPATSVAHELGRRLGWPVYDHEIVEKIAHEMGLRTQLLESIDERHVGWLRQTVQEAMDAVAGTPSVSEDAYVSHLYETILSLGACGECVIVGRGAEFVLPLGTTLRVRLTAPLAARVAAVRHCHDLGEHEAQQYVDRTDREHNTFARDHFRGDPFSNDSYDLVLNSARFSVADCADVVEEALHRFRASAGAGTPEPAKVGVG